ncbi:MAG: PcfJ domain-containing protein [Clostridiales bacterium]|nr:PcfJ domain-containing protein [Candidatus Cacconaster stercorequi]
MTEREKRIEWLTTHAPALDENDYRTLNSVYQPYLFRRRKTGELWTSCCGQHAQLDANSAVMLAEHEPEPPRGYWSSQRYIPKPQIVKCPICGKVGRVKEVGRTGRRDNLYAFDRHIILKWYRGALWGLGVHTEKYYGGELTALPGAKITKIYRFTPGRCEYVGRDWWYQSSIWTSYSELKGSSLCAGWKWPDGFPYCAEHGTAYHLHGAGEAAKSQTLRYCFREEWIPGGKAMRYLALCCVYPRQVEMLGKIGCTAAIDDMVRHGKRNARAFNWDEENPGKGFAIGKDAMREWKDAGGDLAYLEVYKLLAKKGKPATFGELAELRRYTHGGIGDFKRAGQACARHGISVRKLCNYFGKQKIGSPLRTWIDTITAAEKIGIDLENEINLLPKNLVEKHDLWTHTAALLFAEKESEEQRKKMKARAKVLAKKYTYTDGTLLIRPPVSCGEITAEGKYLKHCVGGYAHRHADGKTTILFLRRRDRPGIPLCTIEMKGSKIIQIHGYRNEWEPCRDNPQRKDPRELYKGFLGAWIAWVEAGSKREKKKKVRKTA